VAQVLIIVDAETFASPVLMQGAAALQQAIADTSDQPIRVVAVSALEDWLVQSDVRLYPLTLSLPNTLPFPEQALYQTCQDVEGLRLQVTQQLGNRTGDGQFWLPVVLTAKGPLYAEVIQASVRVTLPSQRKMSQLDAAQGVLPYAQPFHLPDRYRQPLYQLVQRLLGLVAASPAVYLLQFGFQGAEIVFDRLFPFPAAPAIASLGIQTPDLFECHWRCLTHQPIRDLRISGAVSYQTYQPNLISPTILLAQ
jgi:hypothetical protein